MNNYLVEMDTGLDDLIAKNRDASVKYIRGEIYFYKSIEFYKSSDVIFNCSFYAVKNYKTTIILQDEKYIKVHFSDEDVKNILAEVKKHTPDFYDYLNGFIEKMVYMDNKEQITFSLNEKKFTINGIPFKKEYNDIVCNNPADINLSGNDLIGLLNLIFEKERTDKRKTKILDTYRYYFTIE